MKKRAIFGGSFDPIHVGHMTLAEDALHQYQLDEVIFMPTFTSPFKHTTTSAARRYVAVCAAIRDHRRFSCSAYESLNPSPSYAIDTVRAYILSFPDTEWYLIVGDDAYADVDKWKEASELKKLVKFIHYPRIAGLSSTVIRDRIARKEDVRWLIPRGSYEYMERVGMYGLQAEKV